MNTTKTPECLRSITVYPYGHGSVHIEVMEDNTLKGLHRCDCSYIRNLGRWRQMNFFRPTLEHWKLVCLDCSFTLCFRGLNTFDFSKDFMKVTEVIEKQAREQGVVRIGTRFYAEGEVKFYCTERVIGAEHFCSDGVSSRMTIQPFTGQRLVLNCNHCHFNLQISHEEEAAIVHQAFFA